MPKQTFASVITDWEKILATVAANKDDLQHLDSDRQQLEAEAAAAKVANLRQSTAKAVTQQATRDLEGSLKRGNDLADRLRLSIKGRYGKRSEKLTEFGLKVFRGKRKKSTTETPPPAATKAAPQGATSEPHNPS